MLLPAKFQQKLMENKVIIFEFLRANFIPGSSSNSDFNAPSNVPGVSCNFKYHSLCGIYFTVIGMTFSR